MTRSAVLNGPSLHRTRKDVTGTRTQSSSPVSGHLFVVIFMKHLIHKIMKNLQTFLLGATCSLLLIFIVGATNAPNSIIIENEKFEMHNLAEEGKVLIFNKHSGEISYEEIEGEISDMSYSHTIKHSGNGLNLKNFQY